MLRLNRFPKMVVLQRVRAEKLGYKPEEAKAIWMAEATKYAIFKNLALSRRSSIEDKLLKTWKVKSRQELENMQFDDIFKIHYKDWKPFVWGRVFTALDYDRYFSRYWDIPVEQKLYDRAQNILRDVPEDILKNEQKFFNHVWKIHRDDIIDLDNNQ